MSINAPLIEQTRLEMKATCEAMLAGKITFVEGARQLEELEPHARLRNDDRDVATIRHIACVTDEIPSEEVLELWNIAAVEKHSLRWERLEDWAVKFGTEACRNIIARF